MQPTISWPEGKRFAFSVFDDPDGQTLEQNRLIYSFLADLGMLTTIGVWPHGPRREINCRGETCDNPAYLDHVRQLQKRGFEVGFHLAAPHDSPREETRAALEKFRSCFGAYPSAMANHFNAEAIYWGSNRTSGAVRLAYSASQWVNPQRLGVNPTGHVPESPYFWGDIAQNTIRYCRNFVFREINTLKLCPQMPYHDPSRPYIPLWYASADGNRCQEFLDTVSEANQDRLEEEGGACIMYAHFGRGFAEDGVLNPRFAELMKRLSRKQGWFVPVTPLLDTLAAGNSNRTIRPAALRRMEWTWLAQKLRYGTS